MNEGPTSVRLGLKDIRLALAAGESVHAPMPFASVIRDGLLDAIAHAEGELDWSALARVSSRRAGRISEPKPQQTP